MAQLQFLVLIYIESPMFILASCDKSSCSQQTALIVEMGLFEDDRILIKKHLYVMALRNWWKNSQQLVEKNYFELIRETFERATKQRLTEVWSGAQQAVVDEAMDE